MTIYINDELRDIFTPYELSERRGLFITQSGALTGGGTLAESVPEGVFGDREFFEGTNVVVHGYVDSTYDTAFDLKGGTLVSVSIGESGRVISGGNLNVQDLSTQWIARIGASESNNGIYRAVGRYRRHGDRAFRRVRVQRHERPSSRSGRAAR